MAWTPPRWLPSSLALVGLLVLLAQPAAVLDAPTATASQTPEGDEVDCRLLEESIDRGLVDAAALPEAPETDVCVDAGDGLGVPFVEETSSGLELG